MINPDFPPPVTETYLEPDVKTPHLNSCCCWCSAFIAPGMVVSESLKTMRRICPDCSWDIETSRQDWIENRPDAPDTE